MNGKKVAIVLIFMLGITLIVLGGVYNPYTEVVNLGEGELKVIGFNMYGGEVVRYNLESLHTFTIYIMNESEYNWLMHNGTFNGSYYTATGRSMNIEFTAPQSGMYYVVIANFNSKYSIEVDFYYKKTLNWPLLVFGTVIVLVSFALLILEIRMSKKKPELDSVCPVCGHRINSSWNYCPYCRYELRGEKK